MENFVIQTKRLLLREMTKKDIPAISKILKDQEVMYAWEHAFSNKEVASWLEENLARYQRDKFSYWAVILKEEEKLIGVCGIITEYVDDKKHLGLGYIFDKDYWQKGYAYESALACMDYVLNTLREKQITAQVRTNNIASKKLAEKLGMKVESEFSKYYRGISMPHLLYVKILQ